MVGAAPYFVTLDDDPESVLVIAGRVGLSNFFIYNNDSAAGFVQFFDAAAIADVTVGTTVAVFIVGIAATSWAQGSMDKPVMFTNGMVIAFTSTVTGNDNTGSSANVNLGLVRP